MRSLPALLITAVVVLAGCGDDDDEPRAQAATTTAAASGCELTTEAVDQGASVDIVAVLCDGERLSLDGQPAALAIGGTVTHGDGLRCVDGGLVVLSATSDDGVTYAATAVTYEVDGDALVEVEREQATIDATAAPEELDPYYRLDC